MNRASSSFALIVLAMIACPRTGHAEDVAAWFVPQESCPTRPCTCDDIPMMDAYLQNQKDALSAWSSVKADITTPTGPTSMSDAVTSFNGRFSGDARVLAQFKTCPGYDATKNNPNKVAGVTKFGGAVLDPCFCAAYCADIVNATVVHEMMHVPTTIAGVVGKADLIIACRLGVLTGHICNAILPDTLATSEVLSYTAGINALETRLDHLKTHDPAVPELSCTWTPLAPIARGPSVRPPSGFFARVALLWRRVVSGGSPMAVASHDAQR